MAEAYGAHFIYNSEVKETG